MIILSYSIFTNLEYKLTECNIALNKNFDNCKDYSNGLIEEIDKCNLKLNTCFNDISSEKYCTEIIQYVYQTDYRYSEIEQIALDFYEEHEYNSTYRCYDMSKDLQKRYRVEGYKSRIVLGIVDDIGYHAWLEVIVPVESTGGYIVPIDYYKQNYDIGEQLSWN